jgi:hypothetical protein
MAKILVKNSVTPGSAPAGLSLGEMAVNIVDKKIFIGNAVQGVVTLHDQNNIVTSVNGFTGAVSITYAAANTITSSNVNGTRYLTFVGGAGNTGLFIDDTTTPLSYNPQQGNIGVKKVTLTTSSNVITIDSISPTFVMTNGSDITTFGLNSFASSSGNPFDFSASQGLTISSSNGIDITANVGSIAMNGPGYYYRFPTSNGSSNQVLTTNGSGTLSWSTVTSSGGGSGFTYASSAPGTPSLGDRWMDSDTGKEYVYVNDGSSSQWIEPVSSNGLIGITYTPSQNLLQFGATLGFSGGVISDTGYRISSNAINVQTGTSYSLLSSDNGKIITMNNASPITLTVPAGLPIGFNTTVIQIGAGQVGITSSSTTLNSFESKYNLAGQHAAASIISYTTNVFNVAGGLTG